MNIDKSLKISAPLSIAAFIYSFSGDTAGPFTTISASIKSSTLCFPKTYVTSPPKLSSSEIDGPNSVSVFKSVIFIGTPCFIKKLAIPVPPLLSPSPCIKTFLPFIRSKNLFNLSFIISLLKINIFLYHNFAPLNRSQLN